VPAGDRPIHDSYWVTERFLAGEYPGAQTRRHARRRLDAFLQAGVTLFVDLTETGVDPLEPYVEHLGMARRLSRPIPDLGVVARSEYVETLDVIDAERGAGGCVYVHCWGGIGRTGTVVGCWLARHGLDEGDALRRIRELRAHVTDAWMPSPQTDEQRALVRSWRRGE
jgi:hypothetical protein